MIFVARILLTIGFALPLFSNLEAVAIPSQLGALCFLGMCAVVCLVMPRQTIGIVSPSGKVLMLASLMSLLVSVSTTFAYGLFFSILLFGAVVCAEIIRSRMPANVVFECYCYAMIVMVAIVAITYPDDFLATLKGTTVHGVGLLRFSPFNLHPNLAGFMFAGGGMALAFRAFHVERIIWKMFYFAFMIGAMAVVFSASARASLMACAVALLFYVPLFITKKPRLAIRLAPYVVVLGIIGLATSGLYYNAVSNYLVTIFDLDSDTRGLDSGGSGRIELWQQGIDLFLSQGSQILLGNGMRYASPEVIGFSTENSYITILIENGLIMGGSIIIIFIVSAVLQARLAFSSNSAFDAEDALFALMVYAFTQSIFNRYLLGVGNTLSLYLIFVFASPYKQHLLPFENHEDNETRHLTLFTTDHALEQEELRQLNDGLPPVRWN